MNLSTSVTRIPYVGDKYALLLKGLGIETIQDLLYYFPRKYSDSSKIHKFDELSYDEKRATVGTLEKIKSSRTRSKITIQKAVFTSKDGDEIGVTWFNQPFLKNSLKVGKNYLLFGKLNSKSYSQELLSPEVELLSPDTKHIGRISPIYNLTAGIKNKWLRARIKWLIDKIDYIGDFKETLPKEIIDKFNLPNLKESLFQIHFPEDQKALDKARFRIGFEELLAIQLKIQKQRLERQKYNAKKIEFKEKVEKKLKEKIPFTLTKDQSKVIEEVFEDINSTSPMNRLVQGDVGSGKTMVAIFAAAMTQAAGFKTIYIAPTTILSEQIYKEFSTYFNKNVILLNSKNKSDIDNINDKSIIIGTHAIFHLDPELLNNLNLLIIDEEHRFGVKQRSQLTEIEDKYKPHKLTMTATPIPRTLAIAVWGDTDISYIKSKPKNRKEIKTFFTPKSKVSESYKWIREKIEETQTQVFWVCPLIEESDKLEAKSAEEVFKKVKSTFPDKKVRLVHGKTKDKEEQIDEFKAGEFDILVTTAIIEVGIDIPNANIIIIESSERFGLAQLHQFRGRVGRSGEQGYCVLYSTDSRLTEDQTSRIKFFCNTSDGLELSKFDLKRRGPGEVYGTKQSGIPELKIADIFDKELLEKTQKAAIMLLD